MTTQGVNPGGFPKGGELVDEAITLEPRFPQIAMPRDTITPKLRIMVKLTGEPFAPETTQRTDDIVRSYMMKLQ